MGLVVQKKNFYFLGALGALGALHYFRKLSCLGKKGIKIKNFIHENMLKYVIKSIDKNEINK